MFSKEKEALYQKSFEENYDLKDPDYIAWIKIYHPEVNTSITCQHSSAKSSEVLSQILVFPEPKGKPSCKKSKSLTSAKIVCITEDEVLDELKQRI